ncbi:uncharacterized protein LOC103314927 [Tribolium castaneum]|uniref:Uncharacterized protein n=1 Tax=Tribolium castaneum TaxID=7070 RepID=D6WKP7_TRICA|nr:PREDICTED: uncharacterized protein LOC103314927 [Tribolium castaneum]EFA02995.2 hypothetical protein TcasGA2_TC010416 [Tribolium castaneum]|eukprot:XP_008200454.1 PREDICTED: uncharacterized protein LOC103314927 [Tribolium castaneum]
MQDVSEFDFESVLKNYSIQDIALEQSCKQRLNDQETYEETLKTYKEAKEEFFKTEDEHQTLQANFTEKLNINNAVNQLQIVPNNILKSTSDEILAMFEEMGKDSDNFVNLVNNYLKKFQNLGSEFEESVVLRNKADCFNKNEILEHEITERRNRFDEIKQREEEREKLTVDQYSRKPFESYLNGCDTLKVDVFENEQYLIHLNKNIIFLEQRNHELKVFIN